MGKSYGNLTNGCIACIARNPIAIRQNVKGDFRIHSRNVTIREKNDCVNRIPENVEFKEDLSQNNDRIISRNIEQYLFLQILSFN